MKPEMAQLELEKKKLKRLEERILSKRMKLVRAMQEERLAFKRIIDSKVTR